MRVVATEKPLDGFGETGTGTGGRGRAGGRPTASPVSRRADKEAYGRPRNWLIGRRRRRDDEDDNGVEWVAGGPVGEGGWPAGLAMSVAILCVCVCVWGHKETRSIELSLAANKAVTKLPQRLFVMRPQLQGRIKHCILSVCPSALSGLVAQERMVTSSNLVTGSPLLA